MSKPSGELSFEKALAELEKIVKRMEAGDLSLEQLVHVHGASPQATSYGVPGLSSLPPPFEPTSGIGFAPSDTARRERTRRRE
jgi:hypothetical protein